jgi:serine/threonine protein kinase/ABC-type phosphate/phosphonate transport system substrate-binding protein
VPANAPFGHCPKCLLDLGFGPLPDETVDSSSGESGGSRTFGEYELLEQLGRGGMGVVYKARQVALNRPVALKLISAGEFASPVLIQRFHREAEAAANLHHPNIVPIYETGEIQGQHYLSMALIEGIGLDEYIKRAGVEVGLPNKSARSVSRKRQEDIARLLAKVAHAVDHAHQHGVLHRDLKPGNILVDQNGEPHLTDFGLAKVIGRADSSLTVTGAIMGTPSFMAPEQAAGKNKSTSTAADVYSLGAILYAMLTGVPPFRGDTPVETLRQVVEQEPKPPSTLREGIDGDLATIAMKCLEKEPQRRYPSAAALAEDLERWLRKEPIQARSIHPTERFWRWCRRNPNVAALSSAVALLLVVLAVLSTIVAIHIAAKSKDVEAEARREAVRSEDLKKRNQFLQRMLIGELGRLWEAGGTDSYKVESGMMRALAGKDTTRPSLGQPLHLTFGTYFYKHPTNLLGTLAPALLALEDGLTEQLGRTVTIDLLIFNRYQPAIDALASGEIDFGRVGPSSYVQLVDKGIPVRLLGVQDSTNVTLAIFTRKGSDVAKRHAANTNTPLKELLKNCSFAFGDTNSTTGYYLAKWFLMSQGIYAADLSKQESQIAQEAVLEAVNKRKFEVGAANRNLVIKNSDLLVLAFYPLNEDVGRCWVAAKGLDADTAREMQKWLLGLRDPDILDSLSSSEGKVTGFKAMTDAALNPLRRIMRKTPEFDIPSKQN